MAKLTQHLVVFAKAPRLSTVKSRLAVDIGDVEALRIYRRLVDMTVRPLARDPRWRTHLALTPDRFARSGFQLSYPNIFRDTQGTGDLGQRLAKYHYNLPPGPVVFLGTDLPEINSDRVARAFKALGNHDAVIGPAEDGGYWLIGLKRRPKVANVFEGVRWSHASTLKDTVKNIEREIAGAKIKMLEQLTDLDDINSYNQLKANLV